MIRTLQQLYRILDKDKERRFVCELLLSDYNKKTLLVYEAENELLCSPHLYLDEIEDGSDAALALEEARGCSLPVHGLRWLDRDLWVRT